MYSRMKEWNIIFYKIRENLEIRNDGRKKLKEGDMKGLTHQGVIWKNMITSIDSYDPGILKILTSGPDFFKR